MMKVLKNTFSWSLSRDKIFQECPRKYYFNYYGFWGGWEYDAPPRTREIYILKRLKTRPVWIGEVVHDCIAKTLKNLSRDIPVLGLDEIVSITLDRMRADYRDSRRGAYRENPTGCVGFFEHEYGLPLQDQDWKRAAEHVELCLRNFYGSELYRGLRGMPPESFLEIEEFSHFDAADVKVQLKLDLATRRDGRVTVWDWKTGKSRSHGPTLQMACYACYAGNKYGTDPRDVLTREVNLVTMTTEERRLSSKAIEELFSYVRGSTRDMLGLLDDPEKNIASEERFAKVEKEQLCLNCNFFKVCKPNI